jgi:hypothetical protein
MRRRTVQYIRTIVMVRSTVVWEKAPRTHIQAQVSMWCRLGAALTTERRGEHDQQRYSTTKPNQRWVQSCCCWRANVLSGPLVNEDGGSWGFKLLISKLMNFTNCTCICVGEDYGKQYPNEPIWEQTKTHFKGENIISQRVQVCICKYLFLRENSIWIVAVMDLTVILSRISCSFLILSSSHC